MLRAIRLIQPWSQRCLALGSLQPNLPLALLPSHCPAPLRACFQKPVAQQGRNHAPSLSKEETEPQRG